MKRRKIISKKITCYLLSIIMILSVLNVMDVNPFEQEVMAAVTTATYNIDTDKLPYTEEQIFTQLFDINNKISINVKMSNEELKKLNEDYWNYENNGSKSPIYRKADVEITIKTSTTKYTYVISEVGVRLKGNTSRNDFYSDSEGIYNLVHLKLDFQETFDNEIYYGSEVKVWGDDAAGKTARKARKNRTFASLEKLDMKWNRNLDNTFIREYYAYETYRNNGVIAPHTNISSVDWSGNHMGVFAIYEPIDKIFIEKNLPAEDQGGDLYKCGWADGGADLASVKSYGVENEDENEFYCYDLKTNKKTSEDHSTLVTFLKNMNKSNITKATVDKYVDVQSFLKFAAVSYFVGNPDDYRNNYNNYYIYFKKSTGKMIFIPYDMDRCFGIINGLSTHDGMTDMNPYSSETAIAGSQRNPVVTSTICQGGYYVKEYTEALKKVASSTWLTTSKFTSIYNIAKANYSSDVTPSKDFKNASKSDFGFDIASNGKNMTFANYLTKIMSTYNKYAKEADTYTVPAFYIRGDMTDWQARDAYKMSYDSSSKLYKYTFTTSNRVSFKINNGVDGDNGAWYGYDEVSIKPSTLILTTDDHNNIGVPKGTYTIFYSSEKNTIVIGTVKQTITGTATYTKYATSKAFTINAKSSVGRPLTYSSSNNKVVTVSSKGVVTIKGAGVATINVSTKAFGYYEAASKKVKIIVKPKTQSITVKRSKKSTMVVKCKKDTRVKGYEIVYSTNSKFKNCKRIIISGYKSYQKKVTKLNTKKKYYVKARAYILDGTKKYYGKYSTVKKV